MAGWKRNLYVITAAELVAIAGFTVVMPFLPFYVQELGITDPDQVKLWTGWLSSAQSITMALAAPIWGSLADRFGRKIMVERAMFGGAIIFVAMGFVQNVQQLLVLRALQGLVTGTVSAATALVASTTPRGESGSSMGTLQTGIYLGASVGPLVGGVIADTLGYSAAFWITSACLFLGGLSVFLLVNEENAQPESLVGRQDSHLWDGLVSVLRSAQLRIIFAVRLIARLGSRIISPLLPLFIQELVVESPRLATIAGTISGLGAFSSAGGALFLGRKSDQIGHRKMLILCSFGIALFYLPQSLVTDPLQLGVLQMVTSFLMAGILASVAALLATLVPEGRQGAVYGISTTIVASANAIAPMIGAGIGVWLGLRPVFLVATLLFVVGGMIPIFFPSDISD